MNPGGEGIAASVQHAAGMLRIRIKTADQRPETERMIHLRQVAAFMNDYIAHNLRREKEESGVEHDLATVGIIPSRPSPDYGYIECGDTIDSKNGVHRAARFLEKPNEKTAAELLAKGNCKWNSGMFVFPFPFCSRKWSATPPICSW